MSNEVACQVLDVFFQRLAREGRPGTALLAGVALPLEHLRKRGSRIDWDVFIRLMENARGLWGMDGLEELGAEVFLAPAMRTFSLIARLMFDAPGFYRWVFEKERGAGDQTWACIENRFEQTGKGALILELHLKRGYRHCPEFFHVCLGNFRGMPRALGLPPAQVQLEWLADGARYRVTLSEEHRSLRASIRRLLVNPFSALAAGRALKDAHDELQQKYLELSLAQTALAAQNAQVELIERLGRELASHRDLRSVGTALERMFEAEFSQAGVVLQLSAEEAGTPGPVLLRVGLASEAPERAFELASAGEPLGTLELFAFSRLSSGAQKVLEGLVPWVSIALGNARSIARYQQQRETNRLKTEFFDNVSHELRTPLTLILLSLESLRAASPGQSPVHQQHLERMDRSATRLLRLIDQLLDLAKLDAGKLQLRRRHVDLSRLVAGSLAPFRGLAEQKGLGLRFEPGEGLEEVAVDADRMEDVLHNLLSNALRFTSQGEVVVRLFQDPDWVTVEVCDTGIGIAQADLPLVFDRFAQADSTGVRRIGGTGIGLALVKEVLALHGGTAQVTSEPGRGSCFKVLLPRRSAAEEPRSVGAGGPEQRTEGPLPRQRRASSEAIPALRPARLEPGPQSPTVLVVEDEAELRLELCELLTEHGYRALEAEDGEAGLRLAKSVAPALVISDVMMPKLSGLQLLAQLRAEVQTADLPVILLTARHELDSRMQAQVLGHCDYLGKPFFRRELLSRVEAQLRLKDLSARVANTERLAATSLITTGFAHEVRNPLNGLLHALTPLRGALTAADPDTALAVEMLDIIEETTARVLRLAESMLLTVRREDALKPVDLGHTLRAAVQALEWRGSPTVQLAFKPGPKLVIEGDPQALTQVWINLVDNALWAVRRKGVVEVAHCLDGAEAVVTVRDDGVGIPQGDLVRIFDPFFSTRAPGEGTGLGLALCRKLVEQHGGRMEVASALGQGTTFTVRLPLLPGTEGTLSSAPITPHT